MLPLLLRAVLPLLTPLPFGVFAPLTVPAPQPVERVQSLPPLLSPLLVTALVVELVDLHPRRLRALVPPVGRAQ